MLILGQYPPPFGGIPTHLRTFVPYLVDHGYAPTIVSSGHTWGVEQFEGFTVHRLTEDRSRNLRLIAGRLRRVATELAATRFFAFEFLKAQAITAIAEQAAARADLVVAYHLLPWGLAGARLADRFGLPFVLVNFGEIYTDMPFYQRHRRQIEYMTDRARQLVSSSEHCARSFSQIGVDKTATVIPMGVDLERFSPTVDGSEIRSQYGVSPDGPFVLFMGRMMRDMGLHTLLDAIPSFAERAVTLIAGAKGSLAPRAEELARAHPGAVIVATDVPFDQQPRYYAAADIIVAPSPDNRSCMGLAIKEGMAAAKPVVACRVGGIPEAVVDGETGLLPPPEDPEALASAIGRLIDDRENCRRMGAAGRRRAEALFSVELTNRRMEAVCREALAAG